MADQKISAMPAAATLDGTEITPIVQSGVNKQVTTGNYVSQVLDVTPVTVSQGGTNATTAAGARTNLAAAYNLITLTAGTGLSGGGDLTANRSFAIANTGVTAGTYGSSTQIPVIAFNAQGQATSASNVTLSPASISAGYFSAYQDGQTTLTAAIPSPTSTAAIQVVSTAGFPSSGYLVIEQEIIQYTSITATAFDGTITRGALGTTAGKASHAIGTYATEAAATAAGSSSSMRISVVDLSKNITCTVPDSKVYLTNTGIYNIQFSAQFLNYATAEDNITVWLKVNGSDVAATAGIVEVLPKHGSSPGAYIASWNYLNSFSAGDYFEMYWASESGNTALATSPQGTSPTHPLSPGLILTVTQVA